MATVNKVIAIGNVGRDPEVRETTSGSIANLSVACTHRWTDKASGEKKEETEWVRVMVPGKAAEFVGTYVKKGAQVYVEGRLRTRKWKDKEGVERYSTEVVADNIQLLGSRPPEAKSKSEEKRISAQTAPGKFDDMEDDIPW